MEKSRSDVEAITGRFGPILEQNEKTKTALEYAEATIVNLQNQNKADKSAFGGMLSNQKWHAQKNSDQLQYLRDVWAPATLVNIKRIATEELSANSIIIESNQLLHKTLCALDFSLPEEPDVSYCTALTKNIDMFITFLSTELYTLRALKRKVDVENTVLMDHVKTMVDELAAKKDEIAAKGLSERKKALAQFAAEKERLFATTDMRTSNSALQKSIYKHKILSKNYRLFILRIWLVKSRCRVSDR